MTLVEEASADPLRATISLIFMGTAPSDIAIGMTNLLYFIGTARIGGASGGPIGMSKLHVSFRETALAAGAPCVQKWSD